MKIVPAAELAAALKEGEMQLAVINACYSAAGEAESIRSLKTPFMRVKQEVSALSGKLSEALQDLIGKQVAQAGELAQTALTRLIIFRSRA